LSVHPDPSRDAAAGDGVDERGDDAVVKLDQVENPRDDETDAMTTSSPASGSS